MRSTSAMRAVVFLGAALAARTVAAQTPAEQQVADEVRRARQAYEESLDVQGAQTRLDRAIGLIQQNGLAGPTAAQAYALRAVVHSWMGEADPAVNLMRTALTLDPALQVPDAWSGPEIRQLMERARQPGGTAPPPPPIGPGLGTPEIPLTHFLPPSEQLWNHPVPVYIDINPAFQIGGVDLFFRSQGETGYQQVRMGRSGAGYYFEIPCTMIQPRLWEFYVIVNGPDGALMAMEGSPERPFRVGMVDTLAGTAPLRPNGQPVASCRPDGGPGEDCPPGIPCGGDESTPAVVCRSCVIAEDCYPGETCQGGCCGQAPEEQGESLGLFLRVGVGVGGGLVSGSMYEPQWYLDSRTGEREYGPDGIQQTDTLAPDPAFALSGGVLRINFGYFILPELSLDLGFRMNFPFETDYDVFEGAEYFPWLLELRVTYWFRDLEADGHLFGLFLGGGGGYITHRIPRAVFDQGELFGGFDVCPGKPQGSLHRDTCSVYEPFYRPSGPGTVALGFVYEYLYSELLGFGTELAMNAMVPEFAYNFDLMFDLNFHF